MIMETKNIGLGCELWRSEVQSKERGKKKMLYGFALFLLIMPIITLIVLIATKFWAAIDVYIGIQSLLGFWGVFYLWSGWQFGRTYLIIYEGGITVQRPFRGFKSRVASWDNLYDVRSDMGLLLHIKGAKPFRLHERYIGSSSEALQLIQQHLPRTETPMLCTTCRVQDVRRSCPSCGLPVCPKCNEDYMCVACHFRHLNRNAILALCIGVVPLLLMAISLLIDPTLTFSSFLTADLGSPSESATSVLRTYYGISHPAFSIVLIPYGFAIVIANIKRYVYLKDVNWKEWFTLFYIAIGFAMAVVFSDTLYLVQTHLVQDDYFVGTAIAGVVTDASFTIILVKLGLGRFSLKR